MTALVEHSLRCDILVAGGGAAGVPCAIAAARSGVRVILCHDRPVLGGNASSEVRMHVVGANGTGHFDRGETLRTEAREGGIIEEIRLENCVRNPQRSASMFDLILYEKCRAEDNLTLLLNTSVTGVVMGGDSIASAIAERQSTEDRFKIASDYFVDCTGDGRLGIEAGALFMEGREDRQAFGESLALAEPDNNRLGSTILIQARKHAQPMPFVAPDWARDFSAEDLALRLYATPGEEEPTHEYGYWWAEYGGTLDTVKDNEAIRDELLAIVLGIWNHVKNGPDGTPPGADPFDASHWALDWFGFLPGKRESRRFVGHHVLTQDALMTSREFDDAIAYGGWSIDLHPPEGIDAPTLEPCVQHPVPHLYDIPLAACVSKNVSNLAFAGRNISATHVAFASTRVMATCAVMGQGVGTALAHASQQDLPLPQLLESSDALRAIQQQLLRDDCFLVGRQNTDPEDRARAAHVVASSETAEGPAIMVIQGQTRCVHGEQGAPPQRREDSSQRWMSDPGHALPATLELEFAQPITPRKIQLVFDTGMHRHLTLSHHDGYTASKMEWGTAQRETVRDYEIEGFDGATWFRLLRVEGNYQRLRRHAMPCEAPLKRLRISIIATNGLDHVRINEVRVYT
jgi:hypothetical protein